MTLGIRQSPKILAPGGSLRRRVAYSLVIVRLILVPVIFLAVYYLFAIGWMRNASSVWTHPRQLCRNRYRRRCSKPDGPNETTSYFSTLPTLKQTAAQSRIREKRLWKFKISCRQSSQTLREFWMNCSGTNSALRQQFRSWEHQARHPPTVFRRLSAPMKTI